MFNPKVKPTRNQMIYSLNEEETQQYAKDCYHIADIAVIPLSEVNDPFQRQAIKNFCDRKYGKK